MGHDPSDVARRRPSPYRGGAFPADLGAVVQRTVLEGREPARIVVHDADGDWSLADGVHDPNEPEAALVAHIAHLVERDATIAELAAMPPGHVAQRADRGQPWRIAPHRYEDG